MHGAARDAAVVALRDAVDAAPRDRRTDALRAGLETVVTVLTVGCDPAADPPLVDLEHAASDLTPTVRGELYTSLLALRVDPETGELTEDGSDRADAGAFYTPREVVDLILDHTLQPVIDELVATSDAPADDLLTLTVCDPSCGSGHFLVPAAERLASHVAAARHRANPPPAHAVQAAMDEVVERCIVGADVDPNAARLARAALASLCSRDVTAALERHVVVGDSVAHGAEDGRETVDWEALGAPFDVVVGNPPYVRGRTHSQRDPVGRAAMTRRWEACHGATWNLFVPFVLQAAALARHRSGLLVQSSVLGSGYAARLHGHLRTHHGVTAVLDLSGVEGLFGGAAVQTACLVTGAGATTEFVRVGAGLRVEATTSLDADAMDRLPSGSWTLPTSGLAPHLIERFTRPPLRLGDVATIRDGMEQNAAYAVRPLVRESTDAPGELRLVTTGAIEPFTTTWSEEPVRYLGGVYERPVVDAAALLDDGHTAMATQGAATKLAVNGMGTRLEAVVDEGGVLVSKSAMVVVPTDPEVCPYALSVVLNARSTDEVYAAAFGALGFGAGVRNHRPRSLAQLPLPARHTLRPSSDEGTLSALGRALHADPPSDDAARSAARELADAAVERAFSG